MENAYNISFCFLVLIFIAGHIYTFCILYIDYISEFSIYFQYLMECTDIYILYMVVQELPYHFNGISGKQCYGGASLMGLFAGEALAKRRTLVILLTYKELCMETLTVHAPSPSTNLPSYGNGAFSFSTTHVPGCWPSFSQVVYSFSRVQTCVFRL